MVAPQGHTLDAPHEAVISDLVSLLTLNIRNTTEATSRETSILAPNLGFKEKSCVAGSEAYRVRYSF